MNADTFLRAEFGNDSGFQPHLEDSAYSPHGRPQRMSSPSKPIERGTQARQPDGEQRHRSRSGERKGRRRRRGRKRDASQDTSVVLRMFGAGLLCVMLVVFGIMLGLNYRPVATSTERYQAAVEAQQAARDRWLEECGKKGYSPWTCDRFDRAHIALAERLDEFRCEQIEQRLHHCHYVLGEAKVMVAVQTSTINAGAYVAPDFRAHAVINHSNASDAHFVSISESGRIELRDREAGVARFMINPSTGTLTAPDVELPFSDETAAGDEQPTAEEK